MNKVDDASHARETKGLHGSTQSERSSTSSQGAERTRTTTNDGKISGDAETNLESSPRQGEVGSGPQDQGPFPISSLISTPTQPQVVDQTEVQTETESRLIGDETGLNTGSQDPLISHDSIESLTTIPEALGGRSSLSRVGTASDLSSTQQSHPAEPQANHDGLGIPGVERGAKEVVKDSERIATGLGGPIPVPKDVISAAPLAHQDPGIPQLVQAFVQKTLPEGKVLVEKDETVKHDGELVDHSVPSQAAGPMYALGDHEALGASTEQSFSHGRQPGGDGSEQFGELWSDHNGRQAGDGETKIPQTFVVNHPVTNGSVGEPVPGGMPSQSSSGPVAPTQASFSTHVPSGSRADDPAQSAGIPATRSVVVNVTQPDLGHVNVRVVMNNDVVHAHFSSDRLEVGQFFINGQDRLQAALQASGLDMGQFRVDIDRQSGGRSFQQGAFQEQGQSWSRNSHGMGQEPLSDQQDQTRGALQGLLNVVA